MAQKVNITKLIKDLYVGNIGRKMWHADPAGHPAGEVLMMLSGACNDMDKALEVVDVLRQRVLWQRKELRRLNRKLKDRQLGASIYKAAIAVGKQVETAVEAKSAPLTVAKAG